MTLQPPEWAIRCPAPTCGAKAGTPCHTPAGSHPSRLDAWLTQQANPPRRTAANQPRRTA